MEKPRARTFSGSNELNLSLLLPARDLQTRGVGRGFGRLADTPSPSGLVSWSQEAGQTLASDRSRQAFPRRELCHRSVRTKRLSTRSSSGRRRTPAASDVGSRAPLAPVSLVSGTWLPANTPAIAVLSAMRISVSDRKAGELQPVCNSFHEQPAHAHPSGKYHTVSKGHPTFFFSLSSPFLRGLLRVCEHAQPEENAFWQEQNTQKRNEHGTEYQHQFSPRFYAGQEE